MSEIFAKVTATLKAENVPSSQAAEVISGVQQEIEAIKGRISEIEAEALDPLTDQQKAMDLLHEKGQANFLVDRLSAGLKRVEEVHAKALYREEQERRRVVYEAAASKMADVEQALSSRFPQLANEMKRLLRVSVEAMIEAQAANKSLPDDKHSIPLPALLCGDMAIQKKTEIPGYWRTKGSTVFELGADPHTLLKLNP
ncbi:hypothetical protein ACFOYU_02150 [Microvirga sp. GCM10011540]|uniref:hypothetical protein n=1 Tax=Microvirga sp. GCM10011540 TaxID=3317338 RepID=UPI0036168242